jgi:predicted PurR-regulated permease PerM
VVKDNLNSIRSPLYILAGSAVVLLLFYGKPVIVTMLVSVLLAFMLEPLVEWQEKIHIPRAYGAATSLLLISAILYGMSHYSVLRTVEFLDTLPLYSQNLQKTLSKVRVSVERFDSLQKILLPEKAEEVSAVKVKEVGTTIAGGLAAESVTAGELVLWLTFIPFLAYFMLTGRDEFGRAFIGLFPAEHREAVSHAQVSVMRMLRSFITGNIVIGLIIGAISATVYWMMDIPYWYFIAFISGFLSLVPYMGILLAALPPLMAGLGILDAKGMLIVIFTVLIVHLFALNVLYPKLLGKRLQLNPLAVTFSLLFWGFLWGGLGLLLAIPLTASIKIICENVEGLQAWGKLLGHDDFEGFKSLR